jgi:peptide/nickel transport system substrate-binding protein
LKRLRLRRTLAAALLLAAGCNPFANTSPPTTHLPAAYRPSPPAHRGGTLVLGDWQFPQTFDILAAATDTDLRAGGLLFAPLWGLDSGLQPYPDLVREVPTVENGDVRVGADGTTMTVDVKLVPGLRWSDGQPLTADDVIFTWQAICDAATGAAAAGFDHVRAMDKKSDTELLWTFGPAPRGSCGAPADITSGVYGPYLQMGPVFWVMPQHRLQAVPHRAWFADPFFAKPDAGSGPFSVSEVVPEQRITFVPNPHYADGRSAAGAYSGRGGPGYFAHAPYLDRLVYRAYPSRTALLAGVRAGETDLAFGLGADDLHDLLGFSGSAPVVSTGLRTEFLNPNHGVNTATGQAPPWVTPAGDDRQLLEALDLATDREALARDAFGGLARASRNLFPTAMRAWADPTGPSAARDLEGARRLLDEDGWTAGGDGVRVKAGRRLEFQLLAACSTLAATREIAILRRQWLEAGISARTDCRQRPLFFAGFPDHGTNAAGAFDMTVYSNAWTADPGAWAAFGASTQIPSADSPGGGNWNRCRDPELDRRLAAGEATLDPIKRQAAYLALQREWLAYRCTITLFESPEVRQVAGRVHNYAPGAGVQSDAWNAADWWLS